ncbi:hypothetical protein XELAEV_18040889mg [Xenopus laevis]|uniref:Uncharacterized protein n=1 Tax=Xenopus laevis TaxID=8355 RepID=A0A974CAL7_XENLA|nr:hypothetical protein XELAEV_18040889mg [Xenopus laevis]
MIKTQCHVAHVAFLRILNEFSPLMLQARPGISQHNGIMCAGIQAIVLGKEKFSKGPSGCNYPLECPFGISSRGRGEGIKSEETMLP